MIMKLAKSVLKLILVAVAAVGLCRSAKAQFGFDLYGPNMTILSTNTGAAYSSGPSGLNTQNFTNAPILMRIFTGIGVLQGFFSTNATAAVQSGTNTASLALYGSKDTTNWTVYTNVAIATQLSISNNNYYYGTSAYTTNTVSGVTITNGIGLLTTNWYDLPSTNLTPSASSQGWATTYLGAIGYTNGGSNVLTAGYFTWAWLIDDQAPYLRVVWSSGGTNVLTANILARRKE